MKKTLSLAVIAAASTFAISTTAIAADAVKGEALFKKRCMSCHVIDAGAKPKPTGPSLSGFMSRPAGTSDYKYSKKMKDAGFTWDAASLDKWLKNPRKMIKGSRMSFKLKKQKDRDNVIAYLLEAGK